MLNNQLKIVEFKVIWIPNSSKQTYNTKAHIIGSKLVIPKLPDIGEIVFFGPLFKQ